MKCSLSEVELDPTEFGQDVQPQESLDRLAIGATYGVELHHDDRLPPPAHGPDAKGRVLPHPLPLDPGSSPPEGCGSSG